MNNIEVEFYIEKLFNFFNVSTISELAIKLDTKQSSISSWKIRNSINSIKKKCREIGIYDQIFTEETNYSFSESIKKSELSKYFIALESVAIATKKESELIEDIKNL